MLSFKPTFSLSFFPFNVYVKEAKVYFKWLPKFIGSVGSSLYNICDFPGGSTIKNPPASAGDMGSVLGLGRSLERDMATHGQGNLVGYSPWGCRVEHDLATEQQHICLQVPELSLGFFTLDLFFFWSAHCLWETLGYGAEEVVWIQIVKSFVCTLRRLLWVWES